MDKKIVDRVTKSYTRCLGTEDFWGEFYNRFLGSSAEVRGKFVHTDFDRQKSIIERSLRTLVMYVNNPESKEVLLELERIAKSHDHKHRDIPGYMYDLWLKCLIETVKENDPLCDTKLAEEWVICLRPVIEYIKSLY